ncbi:MAG: hypothetical protein WAN60_05985 [Candidatus Sulfotelmatobacter sp.]
MIRKAYWGVAASLFLALAFGTGCNTTTAGAPPIQVITVTANGAYQQNAVISTPYALQFSVLVTTATPPSITQTAVGAGVVVTFSAPQSAGAGGTFANGSYSMSTTTNSSGIATSTVFTANGTVGTYNVIAASPSTESTATFDCANTGLPDPALATIAGGSPQSTTEGTQFNAALSVLVKAAPVPPATSPTPVGANLVVTFTAPDGTFQDTGTNITTALTSASGVATAAPYTASSVVSGVTPYTVFATAENGVSVDFTLSNTYMPAVITPVAGSTPQSTTSGTPFANLLAVTVVDNTVPVPNMVAGAYVTFTAPSFTLPAPPAAQIPSASSGLFWDTATSAYDLSSVSVWTDASGTATPPAFEANALPGTYNVTASVVVKSGTTLSTDNETPKNDFAMTNQ